MNNATRTDGWWTRTIDLFVTKWRDCYQVGGTINDKEITEIAQRGSHHHAPDHLDVYSGDEVIDTIAVGMVSRIQYSSLPAPKHQVYIPAPHTRSTAPPAGEKWCPFIRQACWGDGCHRKLICDAEMSAATKPKRTRRKTAHAEAAND